MLRTMGRSPWKHTVAPGQSLSRSEGEVGDGIGAYEIEPDASAASYFFGAAAVAGGPSASDQNISPPISLQGDIRFVDLLEEMGCESFAAMRASASPSTAAPSAASTPT